MTVSMPGTAAANANTSLPIDTMTSSQANTNQGGCMNKSTPTLPPSATEEEAKRRFNLALTKGVETLLGRGHGRGRASTELLNEIANGCSDSIDEEEIFQTMESLGLSLDDATKVITVSTALRSAAARTTTTTQGGGGSSNSNDVVIGAIDDLTSRLKLAVLLRGGGGGASSPVPASPTSVLPSATKILSTTSTTTTTSINNATIGSSMQGTETTASSMTTAKMGQRTTTATTRDNKNSSNLQGGGGGGRGRKRALADKTPELRDSNIIITENQPSTTTAATATKAMDPLAAKEKKMLNAKLSKVEGSSGSSSSTTTSSSSGVARARSKSPDGGGVGGGIGGARGMRGASTVVSVQHDEEESLTCKRPRTRSQTEESIAEI